MHDSHVMVNHGPTAVRDEPARAPGAGPDLVKMQAFFDKVGADQGIAMNAMLAYLGDRLGIWRALASVPSASSAELAERTGLAERYLREWLAAQAAIGYVEYLPRPGRFHLPPEHAAVLADDDSPVARIGSFEFGAALWAGVERVAHAFATGEGIGWHEQDPRLASAVARFFRPLYANFLLSTWVPAVDGLAEALELGARVIDVGCGFGTPTIMLADAYPRSTFVGVDYHEESIRRARAAADRSGVRDRVRFRTLDHDDYAGGPYDVIFFFDALHDMGDPVGALEHAAANLADGGVLVAVEPFAHEQLEDNLDARGLNWFVASLLACVPNSLAQDGRVALGAQAGPRRTLEVFKAAGLNARVAASTDFNLVYEARR